MSKDKMFKICRNLSNHKHLKSLVWNESLNYINIYNSIIINAIKTNYF